MLKVQAILHDGSVALEFLTDDASDAEEMRVLWLTFDRLAEVRIFDPPGWVSCKQAPAPSELGIQFLKWRVATSHDCNFKLRLCLSTFVLELL